jgi:uncharacterized delta-60 repeat protein
MLKSHLLAFCSMLLLAVSATAQTAGSLDAAFDPNATGGKGSAMAVAVQPDERIIIGGSFATVGGAAHASIARVNRDGSVDASFNATTDGYITCVAVQADGKVVIGGAFNSVNGSARDAATGLNNIARLEADGTLDTTFNTSGGLGLGGTNQEVETIAVQSDGKLVFGGFFTSVNGSAVSTATGLNHIARLNADGTLDTAFNVGADGIGLGGTDKVVWSVAIQTDGKLVLGGDFTSVNGSAVSAATGVNRIARLHGDGTLDTDFNAGLGGANGQVASVVVLGGRFSSVNGSAVDRATGVNLVARLHADGTRDTDFNSGC